MGSCRYFHNRLRFIVAVFLAVALICAMAPAAAIAAPEEDVTASSSASMAPLQEEVSDSPAASSDETVSAPPESSPVGVASMATGGADASPYFHAGISTESDAIANGQYIAFTVDYTIDQMKIAEDDYVMIRVPETLKDVNLVTGTLCFKDKVDLGGGLYKLVFSDRAATGLAGSFTIGAYGNNASDGSVQTVVSVGGASKTITVGGASHGEAGQETRAIEKWAPNGGTNYAQDTAQTGVYGVTDPDDDSTFTYMIEVNPRQSRMTRAKVTDVVPAALVLDTDSIRITAMGAGGGELPADEVARIATVDGNRLVFDFGDRMAQGDVHYRISYQVTAPAGTKTRMTNTADIDYADEDGADVATSRFIVRPAGGYDDSVGYKSVDKTRVSDDPDDQTVTYSVTFESENEFAAGRIDLVDRLDPNVRYVDSAGSRYFGLTYDAASHSVLITNTEPIPADAIQTVTIVTDFTDVPVGYTVSNTVGGNTVKTRKMSGALSLSARKTVNGSILPEAAGSYRFDLTAADGTVLETASNDASGDIVFGTLYFGEADLGKTFTYKVTEEKGTDASVVYDPSVYTVTVRPVAADDAATSGRIVAIPVVTDDGGDVVDGISFDNIVERKPVEPGAGTDGGHSSRVLPSSDSSTTTGVGGVGVASASTTVSTPLATHPQSGTASLPVTGDTPGMVLLAVMLGVSIVAVVLLVCARATRRAGRARR